MFLSTCSKSFLTAYSEISLAIFSRNFLEYREYFKKFCEKKSKNIEKYTVKKDLGQVLIVGLGNPGLKYQHTKHNFGFLLADQIINDYHLQSQGIKFGGQVFAGEITSQKVILIKPQDYMNNSGAATLSASQFYKISPSNIIALHDDLDLDLGRIKAKFGGGNGGHNGLKDLDAKVGKDYCRVRLGIGRPENTEYKIADYVLSKFNQDELKIVGKINQKISKILPLILQNNLPEFLNQFSNQ